MPDPFQPPTARSQVGGAIQRSNRLERKAHTTIAQTPEPILFSYAGALGVSVESPPWYAEVPSVITQVRVSITTAAAGDNTVELRLSGSGVEQFTLPAGDLTVVVPTSIVVFPGVPLTVETIAVSGSNLSVVCRRQPR